MASTFSAVQFTGGMNEWVAPGLLDNTHAAKLVNAKVDSGKLVPLKKTLNTTKTDPTYFLHYGNARRSWVEWYGRHYWSDNKATAAPWYGGNPENFLGIPYPAYSGSGQNVVIAGDSPATGETGLTGTYKYCVTFVSANGWEGAPGSLTEYEKSITLSSQVGKITVTWSDARVSYAKVYRTIASGADFYCVGEITTSGGTFRDATADDMAQMMNPLESIDNYPPPDGGKYLTQANGVFFLAVGSVVYYSVQNNPHAWPPLQTLSFESDVTGIVAEFQGALVFTRNNAYRIVGADSIDTVTKTYIPGNHGCMDYKTIAVLSNAPVWLSNDGICIWDGSNITVVSYQVMHTTNLIVTCAVAADDRYHLFLDDKTAIVYDLKNGGIFYTNRFDYKVEYAWYESKTDKMYVMGDNVIWEYNAGVTAAMEYLSPDIGGNESVVKKFRELYVVGKGASTVTVTVDDEEMLLLGIQGGRQRIKLPLKATGRSMNVKIETQSEIDEVTVIYD